MKRMLILALLVFNAIIALTNIEEFGRLEELRPNDLLLEKRQMITCVIVVKTGFHPLPQRILVGGGLVDPSGHL